MANANLNKAASLKFDEFYTQISDVEKELRYYSHHFKGKTVFCNCDDPYESNFFKYFALNFNKLGLKKLIATCYIGSTIANTQLSLFDHEGEENKTTKSPHKIDITEMADENAGDLNGLDLVEYILRNRKNALTRLDGDGDFRSLECTEILKEADIIVTNPPFSLFREYIKQLIDYEKSFIIIGNLNALKYKETFSYIMDGKIWLGATYFNGGAAFFKTFAFDETKASIYEIRNGEYYVRVNGVRWYTNLDHSQRHEEIRLWKTYKGNEKDYPHYDNYDAIEVDKVKDIPLDYSGIMGVPISFMDKWNPDQFEIVGVTDRQNTSGLRTRFYTIEDTESFNDLNRCSVIKIGKNYKTLYTRLLIKHKGS
jgi:hypothetical protein